MLVCMCGSWVCCICLLVYRVLSWFVLFVCVCLFGFVIHGMLCLFVKLCLFACLFVCVGVLVRAYSFVYLLDLA